MKKKSKQLDLFAGQLPNISTLAATAFELFSAELPKWHKLQETPNGYGGHLGGNCYEWWRSRYHDWTAPMEFERRHRLGATEVFNEIWLHHEREMTRKSFTMGLPKGEGN